jgi:hypothetical protein
VLVLLSLLIRHEYLFENTSHGRIEVIELRIASVDHIVDYFHDFLSIVTIFPSLKRNYFVTANLSNEVVLYLTFVVN